MIDTSDSRDWKRKLDHRLRAVLERASMDAGGTDVAVPALLRFQGDLKALQELGCTVRSVVGDIAVVNIRLADLQRAAGSPSVSFIELAGTTHLD